MDNIPMRPPKLPGYDFVQMLGSGAGKGQRQNP